MNMSQVGKFESLKIINEFDKALIEMFGVNMTDARITRYEVLARLDENGCALKAAESFGLMRGMTRLAESGQNG
jgi:hypothetical protein